MFVASQLVLFSVFISMHSKRTPGLYGLKYFKIEFSRQRNLTCNKRPRPPKNKGYLHVVDIESPMLHVKFHYHTILGCEVTDYEYVTEYGRGDPFLMCLDH